MLFSTCCDAQPGLMKSCLDRPEMSSLDEICLGGLAVAYPPTASRSVLPSSRRFASGPGCCQSSPPLPVPKEAVGWTWRPCVGRKWDRLPKQTVVCQLAGAGIEGTGCPHQAVLVAFCGTELTLLILHLTHSYSVITAVLEHLVLPPLPI